MKRRKKEQTGGAAAAVQVRERGGHPFAALRGYMPLGGADAALYRSVREAVPIVDAAIGKLVRLSGGFRVLCEDERAQEELGEFLRTVNVGHAQVGFNAFLDKYLDSLLTNGRAVGEIVPDAEGREIAAVLCHRVEQLALREGETALDVRFCGYDAAGRLRELPRQELVLFTPLRRTLTPMVERVCRLWLRLHGYGCRFAVEWDDINLQDLVEEAKAELYREQARRLRLENDEREEQT